LRAKLCVSGIVQGVGFRPFVYRIAVANNLSGYVLNRGDAGVEILIEGDLHQIEHFMQELTAKKPPLAQIENIERTNLSGMHEYTNFTIQKSSQKAELSGSIIPPDIATCNQCLEELRNPTNPRFEYFFITCTDCGPRFTIINKLPYDRENTTMREFPLCGLCQKEYLDPLNRRFHAQTVACPTCGPKAYLTTNYGEPINTEDPVREAGKLLSKGKILAVKGYGGFHLASSVTLEQPLQRLREAKHRREKPFAIMAKNIATSNTFAQVNEKEEKLLASPSRPIVLLNKSSKYWLSPLVAPHLHNIGVMLPYTGLHYMLFDQVPDQAFVMTSANPANQPIVKDNKEAIEILGNTVDYFLFHNRQIAHRCDDSVMRVHKTRQVFLRRSRGYAPAPIKLKNESKLCALGLGGELNNTSCILLENKAFISQHIGDVENIETQRFLQEATEHLQRLINATPQVVACDMHPKFNTTLLAQDISKTSNIELIKVQHHHAHSAALLAEHGLNEIIAITCDGYGYGTDGTAWGGEIIYSTLGSQEFERLAHLEAQPLIGGDLASRYPIRLAAGMLKKKGKIIEKWLIQNSQHLPYGEKEAKLIIDQLNSGIGIISTSSCGRVLDAISAILGICYKRTYEGEPAMKLESTALEGNDVLNIRPRIEDDILDTSDLLETIFDNIGRVSASDLAYSAHAYLAGGLAELAIQAANAKNVKNIGFSGGAACNQILSKLLRKNVEKTGLRFFVHEAIPAGDGGVSFGQTVVAGFSKT
jgi:hydrogenase maturation protein HypF